MKGYKIELQQILFDFVYDEVTYRVFFTPVSDGRTHVKAIDADEGKLILSEYMDGKKNLSKNSAKQYLLKALEMPF